MKVFHRDHPVGRPNPVGVELTRRNLTILLAKLDTEGSARTIESGGFFVRAVEDDEHYSDRDPGLMLVDGEIV